MRITIISIAYWIWSKPHLAIIYSQNIVKSYVNGLHFCYCLNPLSTSDFSIMSLLCIPPKLVQQEHIAQKRFSALLFPATADCMWDLVRIKYHVFSLYKCIGNAVWRRLINIAKMTHQCRPGYTADHECICLRLIGIMQFISNHSMTWV